MQHLPSEQKEDRECACAANLTAASAEEAGRRGAFMCSGRQKGLPGIFEATLIRAGRKTESV